MSEGEGSLLSSLPLHLPRIAVVVKANTLRDERKGGRTLKRRAPTTDEGAKGEMGKTNLRRRRRLRRTRVSVVFCRTQAAYSHSYVQEDEEQEEEFGDRRSERAGKRAEERE